MYYCKCMGISIIKLTCKSSKIKYIGYRYVYSNTMHKMIIYGLTIAPSVTNRTADSSESEMKRRKTKTLQTYKRAFCGNVESIYGDTKTCGTRLSTLGTHPSAWTVHVLL